MFTSRMEQDYEEALSGTIFSPLQGGALLRFATIDSTNTYLVNAAQSDASAGTVCVADEQTAGRGRGGNTWRSEPGSGLYLSALLRPALEVADTLKISLAAGLAVQRALLQVARLHVDLRWPNDIVVPQRMGPSKKLGGILTETAVTVEGRLRYAVVGMGVNLNRSEMPPELSAISTSVFLETGHGVDRDALMIAVLHHLAEQMMALEADPHETIRRFEQKSVWARCLRVKVAEDEGYTGVTDGLDDRGLLRIKLADGTIRMPRHGGVREAD